MGKILQGAIVAVRSHEELKQHKIEKVTELPLLFEVGIK
jgi:hypothetical protein